MRFDIYNKFVKSSNFKITKSSRRLSDISRGSLDVIGVTEIEIKFDPLQKIKIEFRILKNSLEAILIGRDFFRKHKFTFVYSPSCQDEVDCIQLFAALPSCYVSEIETKDERNKEDHIIKIDCDTNYEQKVRELL